MCVCVCVCVSCSVVSNSLQPHGLQPARLLCPWNFPGNYWSELPFPTLGDLPDPGIEPESLESPALADGFFTTVPSFWSELQKSLSGKIGELCLTPQFLPLTLNYLSWNTPSFWTFISLWHSAQNLCICIICHSCSHWASIFHLNM